MKIYEVTATEKSEVYIDLDGVLADFRSLCLSELGIGGDPTVHLPPSAFKSIEGTDFFSRIPKFDSSDQLVELVLSYVPYYNICSTPLKNDSANSEAHKRIWIRKFLSPPPAKMVFTRHKGTVAVQADGTSNILIDDFIKNINEWRLAGGIAIQYDAGLNPLSVVEEGLTKAFTKR